MIPQQGIAAIGQQPKGGLPASSSGGQAMAKYFELAKKMSDGQLADIMAGKSMDVPQFVAMTEAMGRRQLRQAVEGAQAQQQAQQPSVKDQLIADYQAGRQAHMMQPQAAGVDQLPAPNMRTLAGGGIIAFDDGGEVQHFQNKGYVDPSLFSSALSLDGADAGYQEDPERKRIREINEAEEAIRENRKGWFRSSPFAAMLGLPSPDKPFVPVDTKKSKAPTSAETLAFTDNDGVAPASPASPAANPPASPTTRTNYLTQGQGQGPYERRVSPFGQFNPEAINTGKLKDEGMGLAALRASKALLSKRGAAGFGEAFGELGAQAAETRKEIRGLEKEQQDFKFNVAKAQELFNQGQDEMAYKYLAQADLNRYHMAMVNKPGAGLEMLQALKDPNMMKIYQQMQMVKKPTEIVSKEKALQAWGKLSPSEKRDHGNDFNNYYNSINNKLLTDTMPEGGDVLGKV